MTSMIILLFDIYLCILYVQDLIEIKKGGRKDVDSREDKNHDTPIIIDSRNLEKINIGSMIIKKANIEEKVEEKVEKDIPMKVGVINKQEFEFEVNKGEIQRNREEIDRNDKNDTVALESMANDFEELKIFEANDTLDIKPVDEEAGKLDLNAVDEKAEKLDLNPVDIEKNLTEDTSDMNISKIQKNKRTSLAMIEVERFVAEEARKEEEQDAIDLIENNIKLQKLNELQKNNISNGINGNIGMNINIIKSPKPENNEVFCFDEYGNRSPAPVMCNNSNLNLHSNSNSNSSPQSVKWNFFSSANLSVKEWDESSKSPGPSHRYDEDLEHGSTSSESSKENQKYGNIVKNLEKCDEKEFEFIVARATMKTDASSYVRDVLL